MKNLIISLFFLGLQTASYGGSDFLDHCLDLAAPNEIKRTISELKRYLKEQDCKLANDILDSKTELDLTKYKISDLSPLKGLNLEVLMIGEGSSSDLRVFDLSPIGEMYSLKKLELNNGGSSFLSMEPLRNLTNIRHLEISRALLKDISFLQYFPDLEYLKLEFNSIKNISIIANLHKLVTLDLSVNKISDLSPLRNLGYLKNLSLRNNKINDVSSLDGLANLESLDLSSNSIEIVTPLSTLTNLKQLKLTSNGISDLSSFEFGLNNLQEIYLSFTNITDISPLVDKETLIVVDFGYSTPLWENPDHDRCPILGASTVITSICTKRLNELGLL